jgi:hypothetical protein
MTLSPMDIIRAALAQAWAEGFDESEIWLAIETAETPAQFDDNISAIVKAKEAMGITAKPRMWDDTVQQWVTLP